MSFMPTLLIGISRVSAWPCTSSTEFNFGFLTVTAAFIRVPAGRSGTYMVSKHRIPRILDDSADLGAGTQGRGDRQAELAGGISHLPRHRPPPGVDLSP